MSEMELNKIKVDVETRYIEDQSNPEQNYYVFAYTITIQNHGQQSAQLLTRHWVKPGEQFVYTSGTMLETAVGTMKGSYQMRADDGSEFDANIDEFVLSTPRVLH